MVEIIWQIPLAQIRIIALACHWIFIKIYFIQTLVDPSWFNLAFDCGKVQLPLLSKSSQQLRKFSNSVHFDNFPLFLVSQNWYLCKQWIPSMTIVFVSDLCRNHKQVCRLWSQMLHTVQVAINAKYQPLILGGRLLHEQTPPWSAFLEKTTLICDLTVRFILQIHDVIGQSSWVMFSTKIGTTVGAYEILATYDRCRIMQQGYASIYKEFKGGAKVYTLVVFPNHITCASLTKTNELHVHWLCPGILLHKQFIGDSTRSQIKKRRNQSM